MQFILSALTLVAEGKSVVVRGPNGEVLDIWDNVEAVSEKFLQMFEESDED